METLIFVYDHQYPELWRDGLYAALKILESDFDITYHNLADEKEDNSHYDYCLGWGSFQSSTDIAIRSGQFDADKYALCIAGNIFAPEEVEKYDTLFYETN